SMLTSLDVDAAEQCYEALIVRTVLPHTEDLLKEVRTGISSGVYPSECDARLLQSMLCSVPQDAPYLINEFIVDPVSDHPPSDPLALLPILPLLSIASPPPASPLPRSLIDSVILPHLISSLATIPLGPETPSPANALNPYTTLWSHVLSETDGEEVLCSDGSGLGDTDSRGRPRRQDSFMCRMHATLLAWIGNSNDLGSLYECEKWFNAWIGALPKGWLEQKKVRVAVQRGETWIERARERRRMRERQREEQVVDM
ncbi:hypothetical protein KIPB_010199, partial [Kipferlia bialata]